MTTTISEFRGGMRQQFSSDKEDVLKSYQLLINGRVRTNVIEPIKLPVEDTSLPAGLKQGIYSFDSFILAFVAGQLYVRNESITQWSPILGITMSATAPRIYVERIPGSYINFKRTGSTATLATEAPSRQSPAALICMDGESQPVLVFPDGSARTTSSWVQWSQLNPEYVPIGKFPMMHDGRLYCVIKDPNGRFTKIVGSVTGRPTDFVLLVNDDGDKAGADENDYGAPALAYSVSYEEITAMARIVTVDGNFLVTTARASYLVEPNYNNTIAGEPTFSNHPIFAVGAIGPESITDLSGNTAVVSQEGIRTFNGVATLRWEGRNDPIIRNIQNLFTGELQAYGATVQFNNYTGFALKTSYGGGIVWWDDTLGQFVALDIYTGAARITQFAVVNTPNVRDLYFITADNRMFKAYAGDYAEVRFVTQNLAADEAGASYAIRGVTCNFIHSETSGYWSAHALADQVLVEGLRSPLDAVIIPSSRGNASASKLILPTYNAARVGVEIRWTGGAKLSRIDIDINKNLDLEVDPLETGTAAASEEIILFVGEDGDINANRTAVHEALVAQVGVTAYVGAGNHTALVGTQSEIDTYVAPYWNRARKAAPFYAVPGDSENSTNDGGPFFSYMRQFPGRSGNIRFKFAEIFLFDTGYTTTGTQINTDNLDGPSLATSTQAAWLIRALLASTARNKIVVWHRPAYTSCGIYSPGFEPMQQLLQRAIDAGATAVVNAHSALYERIVSSIPQFTVGTGGKTLQASALSSGINSNSKRIISEYGFLRLRSSPVRATFEFVDTNGNILDRHIC